MPAGPQHWGPEPSDGVAEQAGPAAGARVGDPPVGTTPEPPWSEEAAAPSRRDRRERATRTPWRPERHGTARWVPAAATALAVGVVIGITLWQMHLSLILSDTTTTGGDTGAHYMMPAYFSSNLFPHLTGWDPDWYDGYPIYTFYFVLPDVLVAIASHVISYNVAFKLATVLGSILLPVSAWALGRLFRLRPPIPAALAAATLPFLFDYTWTIYGGNLFSTLAGEYSYSLSLALALVFVGLVATGLRTGRYRIIAPIVLALCMLSHIVGALFAVVGAGLLTAAELLPERHRLHDDLLGSGAGVARAPGREGVLGRWRALWWGVSTVVLGLLLSGWWLVPFGLRQAYSTQMGYANITTYHTLLFPDADLWALALAAVALVVAVARRSRFGLVFGALGALSAIGLIVDPQGSLYNVRLLPLWFLCVYLLAGWVFGVTIAAVARWWRRERLASWVAKVREHGPGAAPPRPRTRRFPPGAVVGPLLAIAGACLVVVPPFVAPGDLPFGIQTGANQVTNWAAWNYTGYETETGTEAKDYAEYHGLMQTMSDVGHTYGCGRAMWEYNSNQNRFGTPEALMLLPYWTGGCIDSMEGLLFESSTTTPYHFLNQAELSASPSEPMVGLPYSSVNVALGVRHLQLLGVRYFMAFSPQVVQEADADPALKTVAVSGPWRWNYLGQELDTLWHIYLVRGATPIVTALHDKPAVLTGVKPTQSSWLFGGSDKIGPALAFYDDPAKWNVELAAGGPVNWPRVAGNNHDPPVVRVPTTTVSAVRQSASSVSFHVSRVGTPVLVKVSYFPNWQATGAQGPWRVTPNLMVVVPTSHQVTLHYGATAANYLGIALTLAALAGLVVLGASGVLAARARRRRG